MRNDEKLSYLYKKYSKYIKGICMKYTKNVEDAEDCMQDAFMKIANVLDKIDIDNCKTYITKIAINNTIDFIRHNKYHKKEDDIDSCSGSLFGYSTDFDEYQYNDLKRYVTSYLGKKNESFEKIFSMFALENYKHKDISELCSINVNTVRVNYMKSKQMARELLQKEFAK